jgi:uncharacterized hydrophobic protein (TIGR00271 family)
MPLLIFDSLEEKDKSKAVEQLISASSPRHDFFVMIGLSILMATFGLLLDNPAIVIGSMLIAPLLYPALSMAMGIEMYDPKLIWRSLFTILKSTLLGIVLAALVALAFVKSNYQLSPDALAWTESYTSYILIAIIAGFAASYAFVKPLLNERLPGVAISVALIPPVALIGIGLAMLDWEVVQQALFIYLINVASIVGVSTFVFARMKLSVHKQVAVKAVKKEEKVIAKEIKNHN